MSDTGPIRKRRGNSYAGLLGLSVLVGLLIGGGTALIEEFGGSAATPLRAALLIAGAVAVMVICIRWWRSADEAVREAHKWAWYWGGSAGIGVVMILFALSSWDLIQLSIPPYGEGPDGLILTGVVMTLGAQLAGYLVAWAAWWLRHR